MESARAVPYEITIEILVPGSKPTIGLNPKRIDIESCERLLIIEGIKVDAYPIITDNIISAG